MVVLLDRALTARHHIYSVYAREGWGCRGLWENFSQELWDKSVDFVDIVLYFIIKGEWDF